jgi:quinol-cytochrome oxidoreductase complex cytochrome b subunit
VSKRTDDDGTSRRDDGLVPRARRVLLTALSVEVAVLVLTGIALFFVYQPSVGQSWPGLFDRHANASWSVRFAAGARLLHQLASALAVLTAVATGVVVAVRGRKNIRQWPGATVGAGLALTTVAASFTGFLLPWDQLALWAVTINSDFNGYRPLFGTHVRFVLIGGTELSPATVTRWLLIHMLVLGPAVVGIIILGWRRHFALRTAPLRQRGPGPHLTP